MSEAHSVDALLPVVRAGTVSFDSMYSTAGPRQQLLLQLQKHLNPLLLRLLSVSQAQR